MNEKFAEGKALLIQACDNALQEWDRYERGTLESGRANHYFLERQTRATFTRMMREQVVILLPESLSPKLLEAFRTMAQGYVDDAEEREETRNSEIEVLRELGRPIKEELTKPLPQRVLADTFTRGIALLTEATQSQPA